MDTHEKLKQSFILYKKGYSITKIQNLLKISGKTISNYLKEKGEIIKNKEYYKSLLEEMSIKYNKGNISLTQISNIYGIDRHCLSLFLKKKGIKIINYQNLSRINENIFDSIDTEEKAYWLGFIYADGYISSSISNKKIRYQFELTSSLKDKDHMFKFAKFISYENKILIDDYKCRIIFSNKHIWHILNNYGCTPRKSLTLKFPDKNIFKYESLIRDFIRGYVDGDGCLSWKNKSHTIPCIAILGTSDFLNNIQANIKHNKILKLSQSDKNREESVKILQYTGSTARKVAIFLYENSKIYLERKYKKYLIYHELPY